VEPHAAARSSQPDRLGCGLRVAIAPPTPERMFDSALAVPVGAAIVLGVGARNCVVAGQAAFRYLLMSLSHRVGLATRSGAGSLLVLVPDDGPVEKLASQGSDPAFGERVRDRCSDWGLVDLEAFGSEDLVEGVDELAASVTYERSGIGEPVGMV
jgi:hypothetical protein